MARPWRRRKREMAAESFRKDRKTATLSHLCASLRSRGDAGELTHYDISGFGLRVRASGRKYYVVQFRANGRLRRMTLGRHGAVTPETARRRAMALISEAKGGKDPAALRDKGRKAATMKVLGKRFLEEYVPVHCKPSTAYEYRRSVKSFIDPRIGTRKVAEIQRSDIAELHHGMRETPYQANRTLGVLSKMFLLIRDIPPGRAYVLNMSPMRRSRIWRSRWHRGCAG